MTRKTALRVSLLKALPDPPIVLETHGGFGHVFERVYSTVPQGVVFEVDPVKAESLVSQRPTWAVYQSRAEISLRDGVGGHLVINVLDVDPYGEPWPVLEAFFESERPRAEVLAIAVNDGLRQKLRLQGGWSVVSMRQAVERWGNGPLHEKYLEVCRWKLEQLAALRRYRLTRWAGYHCGAKQDMTHYAALLQLQRPRPRKRRVAA